MTPKSTKKKSLSKPVERVSRSKGGQTSSGSPSRVSGHPRATDGVRHVPHDGAVSLITIDEDSPVWLKPTTMTMKVKGAIVRLRPPPDVTDETVQVAIGVLTKQGALAVRVLPRRKGDAVPQEVRNKPTPKASIRAVVLQLVDAAHTSDRDKLGMLVLSTLDKVGL